MSFYKDLVMQTQMNFQKYYGIYRRGGTPYELAGPSKLSMDEKIDRLVQEIRDADCVIVGGASGLSAAGGGNFYYENNDSFKKYFGKFEEVYHFNGAFDGMFRHWNDRAAFWAFLATFLHTTLTAPIRAPYHDLDALLKGKDYSYSRRTRIRSSSNSIRKIKLQSCRATTVSSSAPPAARMTRGMPCSR